ncbi:MAG: hypothetical protein IPK53_19525 [bacterium]|nr:hypothetical protein [bacterium]
MAALLRGPETAVLGTRILTKPPGSSEIPGGWENGRPLGKIILWRVKMTDWRVKAIVRPVKAMI